MNRSSSRTQSNQTTNQTATTTPNVPSWLQQPQQDYQARVAALMGGNAPFVAGPSQLQRQAFQGASNLGAPRFSFGGGVSSGSAAPSSTAYSGSKGPEDFTGPQVNGGGGDGTSGARPATGQSGMGGSNVFDLAGMLGLNAGTAGANTTNGTALSQFTGYNPAGQAQTQGYQAGMVDPNAFRVGQTTVGPMSQATARNFTDANFSAYENPYQQSVTDTTMADIDANDGRIRAQQSAQQAANGGLRNSNNAVLSALTEGELSRARASSLAGIRSRGFDTAAGLITGDNDRQANVSVANAGFANQGVLAQASADSSRNQLLAQLQSAGLLSNQSAYNQASQFGADAFNRSSLDSAGRQDQAGQFGANAFNQNSQNNAGAINQNNQFNAGQQDNALMRQLQAAGLLGNLGSQMGADNRANIGLQGDLGAMQRDIANQQSQSEYARLGALAGLYGGVPIGAFTGQTVNGTSNMTGTGTQTQSGFNVANFLSPLTWSRAGGLGMG